MEKIKLTKGELKRQRDSLSQFKRYLPTLQLKKQQLQIEVLRRTGIIDKKKFEENAKEKAALAWAGLLSDPVDISFGIIPEQVLSGVANIAGVNIPVFERVDFKFAEYDLFSMPLWIDAAIENLRVLISLREEIGILEKGVELLKQELRITAQRVNLFEKVKVPQAKEHIRRIKIYLGDQTSNAVGRSKIAKRKIEVLELQGAVA